jgi:hypothetical protein
VDAWQERDQRDEDETLKLLCPSEWSSSFRGLAAENSYTSRNRAEWVPGSPALSNSGVPSRSRAVRGIPTSVVRSAPIERSIGSARESVVAPDQTSRASRTSSRPMPGVCYTPVLPSQIVELFAGRRRTECHPCA